jgi:hypothetical protein
MKAKRRDVKSSADKDFCDSAHDFSDDASNISVRDFGLTRRHEEEEQEVMACAFLEADLTFHSGE